MIFKEMTNDRFSIVFGNSNLEIPRYQLEKEMKTVIDLGEKGHVEALKIKWNALPADTTLLHRMMAGKIPNEGHLDDYKALWNQIMSSRAYLDFYTERISSFRRRTFAAGLQLRLAIGSRLPIAAEYGATRALALTLSLSQKTVITYGRTGGMLQSFYVWSLKRGAQLACQEQLGGSSEIAAMVGERASPTVLDKICALNDIDDVFALLEDPVVVRDLGKDTRPPKKFSELSRKQKERLLRDVKGGVHSLAWFLGVAEDDDTEDDVEPDVKALTNRIQQLSKEACNQYRVLGKRNIQIRAALRKLRIQIGDDDAILQSRALIKTKRQIMATIGDVFALKHQLMKMVDEICDRRFYGEELGEGEKEWLL